MDRSFRRVAVFLGGTSCVLATLLSCGCAVLDTPVITEPRQAPPAHVPPRAVVDRTTLGRSVEGRTIECRVFGSGPDVTLLIGSIHGSERAGTPLLRRLADHLEANPDLLRGRRVVLIPIVNPDGYEHRSRHNINRVDLNRNFPAGNRKNRRRYGQEALSEPESKAIQAAIGRYRPDRIISIHQPAACVDYDGPAKDLARCMADAGSLKIRRLGSKPGSLGSYAGETLGIPIVNLELPGRASRLDAEELWDRFGPMLLTAIAWQR